MTKLNWIRGDNPVEDALRDEIEMKIKMGERTMKPRLISAPNDPEKMVTPGIIYCRVTRDGLTGHFLGVGWWHWGVGITWIF